jgi:hypothetical protein
MVVLQNVRQIRQTRFGSKKNHDETLQSQTNVSDLPEV